MSDSPPSPVKDPALHKLPPQSIDAEESIISAILIDNNTLIDILEILSADDFYKTAHQIIFTAVETLYAKREPVDLVTLSNQLRENGELDKIGGAAYLARLVDTIPMAVNAHHYARIIHEKAILRRLIERANTISLRCFQDRGDVDGVIEFAQSAIFELSEGKTKQAFAPISKIIETNIDQLEERQGNRALVTGITTGFGKLDSLTSGLQNSDLIILAARPAMGKTAFALNIARNAAIDGGVPVAVFSLEMSKEQLSMRMLCAEARVDSSRIRSGFLNPEDWKRITGAAGRLTDAPIFIDDAPDISATSIRTKSMRLKMDKGLGLIIIDYLQLMRGNANTERRDLEISEISRSLKILAKELNIPVIALSQLNRKLEERSDKRPQLSDLRESGALEQDADLVAFIYRDEVYNRDENNPHRGTAEIILAKQRNGPTGVATLAFLGSYTRFENLAVE
ncbi:Replicative DNA helicase [Desulfosarcina cetonica]|uniref:replicative DNA helicase n=1 Tax=Desulfosarcina cetonica TaxID=90730 RepID=UPI0006D17C7F|nr:replicative DNA helicase [Desulfosarcina cetonica]VTR70608.1 Replicative DNA helicase [Desulfosarcina cetonica]